MTANPLKSVQRQRVGTITPQMLVDQGNSYLAQLGRRDCRWVIRNGQVVIEAA